MKPPSGHGSAFLLTLSFLLGVRAHGHAQAPILTNQPLSQGVSIGSTVTLTAAASGSATLGWQWYFNDAPQTGATTARLMVTNVSPSSFGPYWAVVTNSYGSATSSVATLSYSPVIGWGDGWYGQTNVAPGTTNVVALAGGDLHSVALLSNGAVSCWGDANHRGQTGSPTAPPASATNLVGIAAGSYHSLGVRADGTLLLWGSLPSGAKVPPDATNIALQALGPGAQHALSLRADGTVTDWGGNTNYPPLNVPAGATNFVSVAAGSYHGFGLRADGTVLAWGDSSYVPPSATNIVAIAGGWYDCLGLRANGTLLQWSSQGVPTGATNIVAIAGGGMHFLALRADGKLFAWGDNSYGQTNVPPWATNLAAIAGGSYGSLALVAEGPPILSTPLLNRSVVVGRTAYFRATAVGAWPLSYQWQFFGTNLPGATNPVLVVSSAQPAQQGPYSVSISNAWGQATSPGALLTVLPKTSCILANSLTVTNGQSSFTATSPAGLVWDILGSTNLSDWSVLATLTNTAGNMLFTEPSPNTSCRFYRLRLVP